MSEPRKAGHTPRPFDHLPEHTRPTPTGKLTREGHPIYHNPAVALDDKTFVLFQGTLYGHDAYVRVMRKILDDAAPDLLAVCKFVNNTMAEMSLEDRVMDSDTFRAIQQQTFAAILKATGGAQ